MRWRKHLVVIGKRSFVYEVVVRFEAPPETKVVLSSLAFVVLMLMLFLLQPFCIVVFRPSDMFADAALEGREKLVGGQTTVRVGNVVRVEQDGTHGEQLY